MSTRLATVTGARYLLRFYLPTDDDRREMNMMNMIYDLGHDESGTGLSCFRRAKCRKNEARSIGGRQKEKLVRTTTVCSFGFTFLSNTYIALTQGSRLRSEPFWYYV